MYDIRKRYSLLVKDIEPWNNSIIVDFNVACFDRNMIIAFKDFNNFSRADIEHYLNELYYDWQDDCEDECCEEYILTRLPEEYKNNIVCVIYEEDKEEDEE